ncbi:(S)-sulfolactate dehydrogenase [Halomonas sp. THAF12]|uniref:NAD(P)-dependent oxidoreductase n=1 Tax=Halomonas sp. THAF12 TaxID=2587849 RepID=UPI001268B279|nr:NAD(P)-dependent oxidoreductase [Halomonas sp. THAF12]QFT85949.1 (S)-sulfolactate dehydrogenase [Halomonas sp. THAF12]
MTRILLTHDPADRKAWYGEKAIEALKQLGTLVLREETVPLSESRLAALANGCDIVVSDRQVSAGHDFFSSAPSLKAFVRCAMDIRSVDVEAATRHGVLVTRAGPGFVQAVSEWILAQMINLFRDLPQYVLDYRRGEIPQASMGRQLAGKTVGILGYGNIARQLVPLMKALGMHVMAHDPWAEIPSEMARSVDRDTLLKNSDITVCLVSYSSETDRLLNAEAFSSMPRGAFFVNASRGGVVDESALLEALENGHLGGVALDVGCGVDNTPTLELASHPRVLATPHVGGMVPEAIEFQAMQTVHQVRDILEGRLPEGSVNTEVANRPGWPTR